MREKPAEFLGSGHQCKDDLSPSIELDIYESVKMFYLGLWGCTSNIASLLSAFYFAIAFLTTM
jgi:hypothetical protein